MLRATDNLDIRRDGEGDYWACSDCAAPLGATAENYKEHCLQDVRDISESNPLIGDPALHIDDAVEFRLFCCPACGTLIENEIAVANDPILRDLTIKLSLNN